MDLSRLTPAQLEKYIHMEAIRAAQVTAAAQVQQVRSYYDGDHPVLLSPRQQEYLSYLTTGAPGQTPVVFHHNIVKVIVDMLKERLVVYGFTVNGEAAEVVDHPESTDAARVAAACWQWWQDWRMPAQQSRLYKRTIRDGYSYVMVDYDTVQQRPRATLHSLDDGNVGIAYHRDPEDPNKVLFASKFWWTWDRKERKTVYTDSEVRKYGRKDPKAPWEPVKDVPGEPWPIPWKDAQGKPLGCAVVEFQDPDGGMVHGLLGLQNALNKSWLDLFAAADASGFPIIAIDYSTPRSTKTTDTPTLTVSPGHILETFGGRTHRLAPANLQSLIDVVWTTIEGMAVASRMPTHELRIPSRADFPSGEALKQAETGLVAKAEERQVVFGQAWTDVFQLALRVNAVYGTGNISLPKTNVVAQWKNAATRMDKVDAEVAKIQMELGLPDEAVWARAGMTPEQIAVYKEEARVAEALKLATVTEAIVEAGRPARAVGIEAAAMTSLDRLTPANGREPVSIS